MEYTPRYSQPFSVEQAVLLEMPVITAEIARLQHSLLHLRNTQSELKASIDSEEQADPVIVEAFEENKTVISSQEERISMLRLALKKKGVLTGNNPHYDLEPSAESAFPDKDHDADRDGIFL
ncbi:hypothetical protein BU17DRAFT_37867 [Hysterangium stoloniferum]|nr:hypothetical protein BU17DRAFT_37867 [Hysterangium stoloniferum]